MMPNQPRENGIAQNNGVIEDHWGESPPVLLWAWASRLCPLAWSPHSIALFFPSGMDVTSFSKLDSRKPPPSNCPTCIHTCSHTTFVSVSQHIL